MLGAGPGTSTRSYHVPLCLGRIAAADPLRKQIHLKVSDLGNPVWVGGPGVTTATGYRLSATATNSPSEVILSFTGEIWADAAPGKVVLDFADEGY